jgi:hypothetical protein
MTADKTVKAIPLWLFPVAYLIHVTEEFLAGAGFSLAPQRMRGMNLTPVEFIVLNVATWLLLIAVLLIARRRGFPHLLAICLATVMAVNGLLHPAAGRRVGTYTPGVATGALILVPLGAAILLYLRNAMSWRRYFCGILIAGGVYFFIALVSHHGREMFG